MVYLFPRLFLWAIYFSTRVTYLMASSGKCCAGDTHCSGCWMCTGSDLRNCWDAAVKEADSCSQEDLSKKVECLCAAYGKIAYCWSKGVCCTEYAPTLSAATNLCNLKTYPPDKLTKDIVDKAANDAYNVRNTIWHNDSGYDVPKLSVYVKAYSSDPSNSASSKTNNQDNSSYQSSGSQKTGTTKRENSASNLKTTASPKKTQTYYQSTSHGSSSANKVHHQAKYARQQQRAQSKSARQDHEAEGDKTSQSPNIHGENHISPSFSSNPKNAEIWKRSEKINLSGQSKCGIDFHGVAYPSQVPQSVSQVYATLS